MHADRHTDILLHIQNIGFGLPSRHAKVVEAVYNNQGLLLSRTCFEFRMKGQVLLGAQAGSHETLLWYPLEFQDNEDFWCSTPEEGQGFSLSLSLSFSPNAFSAFTLFQRCRKESWEWTSATPCSSCETLATSTGFPAAPLVIADTWGTCSSTARARRFWGDSVCCGTAEPASTS